MKNSTVREMIVNQFNINIEEVEVNVKFLHSDSIDSYHFEIWWVDGDVHNHVNVTLPRIKVKQRNLVTMEERWRWLE